VDVIKLNSPCITLLDIRMPGIDGYDVLRLIRNDLDLKDHPVWMLSTSSDNQDIETALKTGANGYYSKPTSLSESCLKKFFTRFTVLAPSHAKLLTLYSRHFV